MKKVMKILSLVSLIMVVTLISCDNVGFHVHSFSDAYNNDEKTHWQECSCGARENESSHKFDSSEIVAPTCEEDGYTKHICSCGYTYNDTKVDALGHTEVIDEVVSPTYTSNGLTEGKHCSVCEKVLVAQKTIDNSQIIVYQSQEIFVLPTTSKTSYALPKKIYGILITWSSSDESVISIETKSDGSQIAVAHRPTYEEDDATAIITATLSIFGSTVTKEFTVTVFNEIYPDGFGVITIAESFEAEIDTDVCVRGVVSAIAYLSTIPSGFYLTDDTSSIYVFGSAAAAKVQVGQEIVISAKKVDNKGTQLLSNPKIIFQSASTNNEISVEGAEVASLATISKDLSGSYCGAYIFEDVYLDIYDGGSYKGYSIKDKDGYSINLYSSEVGAEVANLDQYKGKVLKVLFYINGKNINGTSWKGDILKVISATETVPVEEPAHITKTVEELATNKPTSGLDVIYEVEGIWDLDEGGELYGSGILKDINGNQLIIYGLCSTSSVATWELNKYVFKNDKSYESLNLTDNTFVKLGLIYSTVYDNYYAYFINRVDLPVSDAEKVSTDKAILSVASSVEENFILPLEGVMCGSKISWSSDNAAIAISGANATVTRPAIGEDDVTVTLTATITLNDVTEIKEFTIFVKAHTRLSLGLIELAGSLDLNNVANRLSWNRDQQVWSANGITLTNDKASSIVDVDPNYTNPPRFFKDSSLTIELSSEVYKIVFHCNDYPFAKEPYTQVLSESFGDVDFVIDGYDVIVIFEEPVTSFVISQLSSQVRIDSIDIWA